MPDKTPQAIEDCHQLILWVIPAIERFPRHRRFTVGERIETGLLDVLEALTEAAYSRDKRRPLQRANLRLSQVRHLWRLAMELGDLDRRRYEHGARLITALGAQVGGWRKAARA